MTSDHLGPSFVAARSILATGRPPVLCVTQIGRYNT